jgi:hypothetical protein
VSNQRLARQNNMFDLDQAMAEWRRQMLADGIQARDVLDELESHLREDLRRRVKPGIGEERAFELAAQQLGEPEALKAEFIKVESKERKYMKRGLIITLGIIGVLVGMAFVMPAVAQYRHEGAMRNGEPWLFLIGSLLTLAGVGAAIRGGKKSRA